MSRRKIKAGSTSQSMTIFVQDTSSTTGAGLGLLYNTASLAARYRREGQSSWTSITLASMTLGTWVSGGFVAAGGLTGNHEFGIPDAAIAAGAKWVNFEFYGAANMFLPPIEIELDTIDYQSSIPSTSDIATALLVDGGTNKLKVNADHSVTVTVDEAAAEAIAAAVVAALAEVGVAINDDSQAAIVQAVAQTLSSEHWLTIGDNWRNGTEVQLVAGDDYLGVDGRALPFSTTGEYPVFTGGTPKLYIGNGTPVTGSIVTATGGSRAVAFDLGRAATTALLIGGSKTEYQYRVRVELANGDVVSPSEWRGQLTVVPAIES